MVQQKLYFCGVKLSCMSQQTIISSPFDTTTAIPRLTKIIRSGITFISRSSLCYQASHFSLSRT